MKSVNPAYLEDIILAFWGGFGLIFKSKLAIIEGCFNTPLWNTPLNLYQQAVKGILSEYFIE